MPFRFAQWGAHGRLFSKWDQPELKPNWFDIEHGRFSWPVCRGPKNCPCPVFGFAAKEMVAEKSFIFRISKGEFLKLELSSRRRGKGRQKVSVGHFWAKAVGASSLEIHSIQWCIVSRRGNGPKLSRDFFKVVILFFPLLFSSIFALFSNTEKGKGLIFGDAAYACMWHQSIKDVCREIFWTTDKKNLEKIKS